jgi:hypothetical protein
MHTVEKTVAAAKALVAKVYGIISHKEMHDDEFMARWFLRTFGEQLLPGIRTAPLQLVDSGIRMLRGKTGAEWFAAGYPCLGTCGGPLDEHELPPEKRTHASAATLAAQMLGIQTYAPVVTMLTHAVRVDRTATATTFDISAVIKAMHRYGVPISKMCRMYDRIADAWFMSLSGTVRNKDWSTRPTFDALAAEWIVNNLAPEGFDKKTTFASAYDAAEGVKLLGIRTLRPLLDYFIAEERRDIMKTPERDRMFEMGGIVDALNRDNVSERELREIVFTILDAKFAEQVRFMSGYDELVGLHKAGRLYVTGTPLRIMHVVSDNPEINRAARKLDKHHDIFIQRGPDGHVVVWYNKTKFNMDGVAARLRMCDLRARRQKLPWDRCMVEGTIPEAPWWYYNPANGQIMNGSRTNQGAPVTKLDDNTVIRCIVSGLEVMKKN